MKSTSVILFDEPKIREQLLPFSFTRPVALIRCGILTVAEKWEYYAGQSVSFCTQDYLSTKFPISTASVNLFINGALLPDANIWACFETVQPETVVLDEQGRVLGVKTASPSLPDENEISTLTQSIFEQPVTLINNLPSIIRLNGEQITSDYLLISKNRESAQVTDPFTRCYSPDQIFIEPGAEIKAAILNAESGPIYIGKGALISEGAVIQGPFAIGEGSTIAQGAKIRPNTTVGPYCKVGGEVNNSVFFSYSNKGHDGYLGSSVIGEWCNLGANTNNSNLKNDYSTVSLFNYRENSLQNTGVYFCGVFMGDYTKTGISTMFTTGTVVGTHVNVFGAGFQPKHIPSFSWGGKSEGFAVYRYDKAIKVSRETMKRRNVELTSEDEKILWEVFERTTGHRQQEDIHSFRNDS